MHVSPRSGRQTRRSRAVARFTGSHVFFIAFDPGACAPGFMLSPASQAKYKKYVRPKRAKYKKITLILFDRLD